QSGCGRRKDRPPRRVDTAKDRAELLEAAVHPYGVRAGVPLHGIDPACAWPGEKKKPDPTPGPGLSPPPMPWPARERGDGPSLGPDHPEYRPAVGLLNRISVTISAGAGPPSRRRSYGTVGDCTQDVVRAFHEPKSRFPPIKRRCLNGDTSQTPPRGRLGSTRRTWHGASSAAQGPRS